MFNLVFIITCLFQVIHSSNHQIAHLSNLNTFELENFKYQIDIDKEIKLSNVHASSEAAKAVNMPTSTTNSLNVSPIRIKSKHGQDYECYLPRNDEFDELDEITSTNKNSISDQFNFTLVNEQVKNYASNLKDSKTCIYKNFGWWTYELCFGSEAHQYHLQSNGSISGEKISLGVYAKDYDWLSANSTSYPISSGILYHEQYYEMGSICELNQKPRRSVVKIFCDETNVNHLDSIDLISEIETCVYEIHINSYSICKIPYFSKKPNSFNINCSPVVDPEVYDKYLEEKKASEVEKDEKQPPSEEKIQNENLDFSEETISSLVDNLANDYLNMDTSTLLNSELDEEVKIESEDDDLDDLNTETKLNEIKSETMNKLDKLTGRAKVIGSLSQQLTNLIDELASSADFSSKKEESNEKDESENSKLLEEKKEAKTSETDLDKLFSETDDNNVNSLEEKIAEQLSKRQELVDKFKTNKFKVKIVRFDLNSNKLQMLNEDSSNDLSSLITSLLNDEPEIQKFKKLQKNYDFVYNANNPVIENFAKEETENDKENDNNLIIY